MRKFLVAALLSALPYSAQAQSVRQVFQEFGLIGVWASACGQPASSDGGNVYAIYALAAKDGVMLTYDNGPKHRASVYDILSAKRVSANRLTYVEERLQDKARVPVTVLKKGEQISVWSSVLPDGKVLVQNGRQVASGSTNPPRGRCL